MRRFEEKSPLPGSGEGCSDWKVNVYDCLQAPSIFKRPVWYSSVCDLAISAPQSRDNPLWNHQQSHRIINTSSNNIGRLNSTYGTPLTFKDSNAEPGCL